MISEDFHVELRRVFFLVLQTWIRPRIKAMQQAWLLVVRKDLQLYTSLQQSIKTAAQSAREAKDHLQPHSEESNEADVITETPGDEITASLGRLDGSVRVLEEAPASQSALSELQSCKLHERHHLSCSSFAHRMIASQPSTAFQDTWQQHPTTRNSLQTRQATGRLLQIRQLL